MILEGSIEVSASGSEIIVVVFFFPDEYLGLFVKLL